MTDTSSERHNRIHEYAVQGDAFPGSMGHGSTAQSIRAVVELPEILAQAEVGKPAIGATGRKVRSRASKKPRT